MPDSQRAHLGVSLASKTEARDAMPKQGMAGVVAITLALLVTPGSSNASAAERGFSLRELAEGQARNVTVSSTRLHGRAAVELRPAASGRDGDSYLTVPGSDFQDGEVSLDIAAEVLPGEDASVRAFAGLGFRSALPAYEAFYLRMLNGRARDQIQRNHAAQYISHPDYGWARLRRETPGVYESYVDLQPRTWTRMRIVVCGSDAALYVNGATQPTLVVHDLKHGPRARGPLLLWVGPGTAAQFANLKMAPGRGCGPQSGGGPR